MLSDYIGVRATDVFGWGAHPTILIVHGEEDCAGEVCCIHNPSNHHMVTWEQLWRGDVRVMERLCPHGLGHPDPDDLRGDYLHLCDGCCHDRID